MKYLTAIGLLLIGIPACLSDSIKTGDKQCFSQPTYPCCTGNKVVLTDESGSWGIENGKWCGISNVNDTCFSVAHGYPCCVGNKVIVSDESGDWGVENGKWCGIGNGKKENEDSCFSVAQGYPCCKSCKVVLTDSSGKWGVENNQWCGIKDSCTTAIEVSKDNDFDFTFLKLENNKENIIYSPLSIRYALKMLEEGAANNTFDEINKVIGNSELTKYANIDKNLSLANGLFIRDIYYKYINTEYINTLKQNYDAEVVKDEFKDAKNANQWIEDKTLGIIKNTLDDKVVSNPRTVMLIINALAIDMEWYNKFEFTSTHGRDFYLNNGENVEATMMRRKIRDSSLSYYIDDDVTVVTMDLKKYGETQFEFMAIMPTGKLSTFVENVTKDQINKFNENLNSANSVEGGVELTIPKFKFNYSLKLKDNLQKLGIQDAFDMFNADFSKMEGSTDPNGKLYVSDAIHKADINFTEKGVKAAAVTVVIMAANGIDLQPPKKPIVIEINKPFMFVIRDKTTKDIWFTGNVYEPNLWENDKESYKEKY